MRSGLPLFIDVPESGPSEVPQRVVFSDSAPVTFASHLSLKCSAGDAV